MESYLGTIRLALAVSAALVFVMAAARPAIAGTDELADPASSLWYDEAAKTWIQALPIGNGRLGAMVLGGVNRERIALNEESVWSGSTANNDRPDAAKNLPEIRRLLLAGKNVEAEALVNQTFTCQGAGTGRGHGAGVPFGCYQTLGDLRIAWKLSAKPALLNDWKWSALDTGDSKDFRQQHRKAQELIAEAVKPDANEKGWNDYQIANGKAVRGDYAIKERQYVVLRHHLNLTKDRAGQLGVLRVAPANTNGFVYVNGHKVGELAGWRAMGNAEARFDVSGLLTPGDNVVAVVIHRYRRHGRLPLSVVIDPRENAQNYRRSLDLRNAVATVSYQHDGVTFTREAFASAPDEVMAFRFTADKPGQISFTASMDRMERFRTKAAGPAGLVMTGTLKSGATGVKGLTYAARLRAIPRGGKVVVEDGRLRVEAADEVVLLVAAATNYQGFAGRGTADPIAATKADLDQAAAKSYEAMKAAHIAEHRGYFDRVSIALDDGKAESRTTASKPTDERLRAFSQGAPDPALAALYFNYGRYLLIGSSRPGCMPANLQGLWAEGIQTPWNCDYHLDINVQMNYWPAEVCNLGDCHKPLLKLIDSLQKPGAKTARSYYNADGWVAHVITNVWGFTAPGEQASWGATAQGTPRRVCLGPRMITRSGISNCWRTAAATFPE